MKKRIHQFVLDQLQLAKGRWGTVAEESGVPRRTVEKIAREEILDPGISHVDALVEYFGGRLVGPKRGKRAKKLASTAHS